MLKRPLPPEPTKPTEHPYPLLIYFLSSSTQAGALTIVSVPLDKAMYLSQIHRRPVLRKANFIAPYQGSLQTVVQKCIFGSTYFIAQDEGRVHLFPLMAEHLNGGKTVGDLSVGLFAGASNGILGNPLSTVKYHAWCDDKAKYLPTAREMWKHGRWTFYLNGTPASALRDSLFGMLYEGSRGFFHQKLVVSQQTPCPDSRLLDFGINSTSGILASILSSPINYARNKQHHHAQQALKNHTPLKPQPSTPALLSSLYAESKKEKTPLARLNFLANACNMKWIPLRVGGGMALSQFIYEEAKEFYEARLPMKKP